MSLNRLGDEILANAHAHGFGEPGRQRPVAEHVALIHTEVSEIYEAHRDGYDADEFCYEGPTGISRVQNDPALKPIGVPSEVADVIIRALNFCAEYDIDIDRAVAEKMTYNRGRPYLHGGKLS